MTEWLHNLLICCGPIPPGGTPGCSACEARAAHFNEPSPTDLRRGGALAEKVQALADISLTLRRAAREYLGLNDGDYFDSRLCDAQARALLPEEES